MNVSSFCVYFKVAPSAYLHMMWLQFVLTWMWMAQWFLFFSFADKYEPLTLINFVLLSVQAVYEDRSVFWCPGFVWCGGKPQMFGSVTLSFYHLTRGNESWSFCWTSVCVPTFCFTLFRSACFCLRRDLWLWHSMEIFLLVDWIIFGSFCNTNKWDQSE